MGRHNDSRDNADNIGIYSFVPPAAFIHVRPGTCDTEIGTGYLRRWFAYILFALMFVQRHHKRLWQTIITMSITIFSVWLVRIPLAAYLSSTELGIRGIWLAVVIGFAAGLAASLGYYFSGRWKKAAFRPKQV